MNKFVSFLESFGLAVLRSMNIIPAVTTVLESSAGQPIPVLDKLSQIASLVKQAEVMFGAVMGAGSGPQKASAIAPAQRDAGKFDATIVLLSRLDPWVRGHLPEGLPGLLGTV